MNKGRLLIEVLTTPGEAIAAIREQKGLSRYRLAKMAGVTQTTLDATEAGADARLSTAIKLFRALGREGRAAWAALLSSE